MDDISNKTTMKVFNVLASVVIAESLHYLLCSDWMKLNSSESISVSMFALFYLISWTSCFFCVYVPINKKINSYEPA